MPIKWGFERAKENLRKILVDIWGIRLNPCNGLGLNPCNGLGLNPCNGLGLNPLKKIQAAILNNPTQQNK